MDSGSKLTSLLRRASSGDEVAAEEILRTFTPRVLSAVRLRLGEKLRRDYDSGDFAQDVWQSFFDGLDQKQFTNAQALCSYLALLAQRKVQKGARRETTLKRGGNRKLALDSTLAESSKLMTSAATPSEEAVGLETWQQVAHDLSDRERRILQLRYQGYTNVEIAAELDITESSIRRFLEKVQQRLRKKP